MSLQSKDDIERWFEQTDPWGYETNESDALRKAKILEALQFALEFSRTKKFKRALDIGAAEGYITRDLPAEEIEAIEVSDNAAARFPKDIKRVHAPSGKYDLIVATGVLYGHYDYETMRYWIKKHAKDIILFCHYDKVGKAYDTFKASVITKDQFPYRDGKQILKVFKC